METLDAVGLGTMGITDSATIALAIESGYRHLDTAQIYDNESVVGEGIARADLDRSSLFISTKVWIDRLEYEAVIQSTRESLDRLGLEYVDMLYVHRPRETYDPDDTFAAFEELVNQGMINHIGVSNFEVSQLQKARTRLEAPIFANQVEYHPLFQPDEILSDAQDNNYYLVAYSPLANGRASEIPEVVDVAQDNDVTPEAVCIAWLTDKDNVVVIPKASSEAHLRANRDAATLKLDSTEKARIDGIERETEFFLE